MMATTINTTKTATTMAGANSGASPDAMVYAFITWDASRGRRMCPLATFGSRAAMVQSARLVCVDPPRADRETLVNAADVRGSIALVVRGGCSFAEKARRIHEAGAVAMILANNTRDEPFAMFTMAVDAADTEQSADPRESPAAVVGVVPIPCVMMCLHDVRELFKMFPPSVKTGILTFEIHTSAREQELVADCERQRLFTMQKQGNCSSSSSTHEYNTGSANGGGGGGWGASLKRTTTSLIKRWDSTPSNNETPNDQEPTVVATPDTQAQQLAMAIDVPGGSTTIGSDTLQPVAALAAASLPVDVKPKPPLFAFVQWATSATEYILFFAPLADFCLVANHATYEGKRVACDPLLAHQDPVRNASELVDAVALVKRGACTFPAKLERVQRCGAAAVIVGNDDRDDMDTAFVMSVDQIKVDHLTIPAVMVSSRVFTRLVEDDKPMQLRILCLSGEAAAECLAMAGTPIGILDIPFPQTKPTDTSNANDEEDEDDDRGQDPLVRLHTACRAADHGACQRVLEEACADESTRRELVMARDKFQLSALHHACAAEHSPAANEHVVSLLLHHGAHVTMRDLVQHTPLHFACLRGHAASVKKLLSASINSQELTMARNLGGATPIHYAARAGSTECLELLLSVNARRVDEEDKYLFDGVDERDVDGATPLHLACAFAQVDCVMYLVAANADLTLRDHQGRTALQIACALVNEPVHSIQALHIVEKLMDAGAPVFVEEDEFPLAIDAVTSKPIKRELEVAFLRREALQSRTSFRKLSEQLQSQNEAIHTLQNTVEWVSSRFEDAQRVAADREMMLVRQQRQTEQLQLQMKTLLQLLHTGGGGGGGVIGTSSTNSTSTSGMALLAGIPSRPVASSPSETPNDKKVVTDSDEEQESEAARAQDAALARDLGKKCCRERQFVLAQTYFERSLDVFPLPGVTRLLEEAKAMQRQVDHHEATESMEKSRRHSQHGGDAATGDVEKDCHRLQHSLAQITAMPKTKEALEREISKLKVIDSGSCEYSAALKWIEWLLTLPWHDDAQANNLLTLEASMFDEIERMETEQLKRRHHQAARLIQRTFRERYAVHLLRRVMASERIQRACRAYRKRHPRRHGGATIPVPARRKDTTIHSSVYETPACSA